MNERRRRQWDYFSLVLFSVFALLQLVSYQESLRGTFFLFGMANTVLIIIESGLVYVYEGYSNHIEYAVFVGMAAISLLTGGALSVLCGICVIGFNRVLRK